MILRCYFITFYFIKTYRTISLFVLSVPSFPLAKKALEHTLKKTKKTYKNARNKHQ